MLDGAAKIGAKILISGGGRCNVTNHTVAATDFNGSSRNAIARVLRTFDVPAVTEWFESHGVRLKIEETGKLFPTTDRARTVLDALLRACDDAGAMIRTGRRVVAVRRCESGFALETSSEVIEAGELILATGGRSLPKSGSDGAGYELARALGHSIVEPFPALVPLLLPEGHWMTGLSGVSFDAEVRVTSASGAVLHRSRGAVLLTHFGLSGPAILDVSRHWIAAHHDDASTQLRMALAPGESFERLESRVVAAARSGKRETAGSLLRQIVTDRLAVAIAEQQCGTPSDTPLTKLTRDSRRALIHALTDLTVVVRGNRGFDYAEVTAGGVPLTEVDTATMQSRRCPGLFLCGEIFDVDGRIGGFNFQWAWASGRLAGINAARCLERAAGSLPPEPNE